ncbi:hypothetical protein BCR34DRAFT_596321 [Clohesyomyces aquaticus]|uniref:Uncharacterized protein n=1 Tax=Clohesyomyces aquaticus TaxID=1231657 RepID=A0A1Y2A7E7_9PLEO|nr:hypothetical protein BCR34DRAFT_596321 [Clohesyomyces aquaticus]
MNSNSLPRSGPPRDEDLTGTNDPTRSHPINIYNSQVEHAVAPGYVQSSNSDPHTSLEEIQHFNQRFGFSMDWDMPGLNHDQEWMITQSVASSNTSDHVRYEAHREGLGNQIAQHDVFGPAQSGSPLSEFRPVPTVPSQQPHSVLVYATPSINRGANGYLGPHLRQFNQSAMSTSEGARNPSSSSAQEELQTSATVSGEPPASSLSEVLPSKIAEQGLVQKTGEFESSSTSPRPTQSFQPEADTTNLPVHHLWQEFPWKELMDRMYGTSTEVEEVPKDRKCRGPGKAVKKEPKGNTSSKKGADSSPNAGAPNTSSPASPLLPQHFTGNAFGALDFRTRLTASPWNRPEEDDTIGQVLGTADEWLKRIFFAIQNVEGTKDNGGSADLLKFSPENFEKIKVEAEAVGVEIFIALISRVTRGTRQGTREKDPAMYRDRDGACAQDREGNCLERIKNVVNVLRNYKQVCRDVLNSFQKIEDLVNAPLHVAKNKDANMGNNNKRKEQAKQMKGTKTNQSKPQKRNASKAPSSKSHEKDPKASQTYTESLGLHRNSATIGKEAQKLDAGRMSEHDQGIGEFGTASNTPPFVPGTRVGAHADPQGQSSTRGNGKTLGTSPPQAGSQNFATGQGQYASPLDPTYQDFDFRDQSSTSGITMQGQSALMQTPVQEATRSPTGLTPPDVEDRSFTGDSQSFQHHQSPMNRYGRKRSFHGMFEDEDSAALDNTPQKRSRNTTTRAGPSPSAVFTDPHAHSPAAEATIEYSAEPQQENLEYNSAPREENLEYSAAPQEESLWKSSFKFH